MELLRAEPQRVVGKSIKGLLFLYRDRVKMLSLFCRYGTVAADTSSWAVAQDNIVIILGSEGKERSFRAALNTSAWGEIKVPFADAGWYDPNTVDLSAVTYVKIMVAGATFDVHFDQIGWY